jgi:hypothetical protein
MRGRRAGCNGVSFPSEPKFVQKFLSIKSQFVFEVSSPLRTNPHPKRHVFLAPSWNVTVTILLFKLDQLFMLLFPWRIVINFPNEPDLVQKYLSIKSNCVFAMKPPLPSNPPSKSHVFLVRSWHDAMTIRLFKLDQLFILRVPGRVGVGDSNFPNEPDFVQKFLSIKSHFVISVSFPLRINPNPKSHVFLVPSWHDTIAIFFV